VLSVQVFSQPLLNSWNWIMPVHRFGAGRVGRRSLWKLDIAHRKERSARDPHQGPELPLLAPRSALT
jgi:hypothetical protein